MEESPIEFYYAGKMLLVRCESLVEMPEEVFSYSPRLVGDIRRGVLIDTEYAKVEPVLYTHDGLLDNGWLYVRMHRRSRRHAAATGNQGVPL